jgi:hypothetical protein
MDDFQGNSDAAKRPLDKDSFDHQKKVETVTNNVTVKKENDFDKFKKHFFAEDAKAVGGHVLNYVVVPGLQKILSDIVKQGIDWLIYGSKGSSRPDGVGNVSYSRYYTSPVQPQQQQQPQQRIGTYYVNDVLFNERQDAEEVLLKMNEAITKYGMVSVADFYDMIGQHGAYTDQKYGWFDLRQADVVRNGDGYSIYFPKVRPIE